MFTSKLSCVFTDTILPKLDDLSYIQSSDTKMKALDFYAANVQNVSNWQQK